MASLGLQRKQPSEVMDYDIDFSEYLPEGDELASAGNPPTPTGCDAFVSSATETSSTLVIDNVYVIDSGKTLKVWVSGGTNGVTYKVTLRATTAGGRVKEVEFKVKVKDN